MPSVTPSLVTHAFARVRPVGALWRLRGYLKPYRTQMFVMFAAGVVGFAAFLPDVALLHAHGIAVSGDVARRWL